jgi:hypothetical protein
LSPGAQASSAGCNKFCFKSRYKQRRTSYAEPTGSA